MEVGRAGKYKKEAQQARHLGEVCSQKCFFAWLRKKILDPPKVIIDENSVILYSY